MSFIHSLKARGLRQKADFEKAKLRLKLFEAMPEFARDPDESEWVKVGAKDFEVYDEYQMEDLRNNARKIYYTIPLARGIIDMLVNFIIGRNFKIVPEDTDEKVEAYWEEFWETNKMDLRVKEWVKNSFRDGEVFPRFFNGKGENAPPFVRFIRPSQIKSDVHKFGIETDPQDVETPINYYREFTKNNKTVKETIPANDIIHTKILVDFDIKRGLSFLIGIIKYIKDYSEFLNDRKTINKIRTIYNLIVKPTGSTSTSNFMNQYEDTNINNTSGNEGSFNKKLPKSGTVIFSKGADYDFKNLNVHAEDTQSDGRAMLLMIVAGTNMAEYMVTGDGSNANYASTMVTESPAVRCFEAWQDFFAHSFRAMYKKVIMDAVNDGVLPEKYEKTTQEWDTEKRELIEKKEIVKTSGKCKLDFPILIHRDIEKETKALSLQNGMGITSKRTAANELGRDFDIEQKQIIREAQEEEIMGMGGEKEPEGEE